MASDGVKAKLLQRSRYSASEEVLMRNRGPSATTEKLSNCLRTKYGKRVSPFSMRQPTSLARAMSWLEQTKKLTACSDSSEGTKSALQTLLVLLNRARLEPLIHDATLVCDP